MSDPRIEKLPKWAQDEFRSLQRERDTAVRKLQEYEDAQTESPISYTSLVSDGAADVGPSIRTRYINGTNKIEFEHKGVHLRVMLTEECPSRSDGIHVSWSVGQNSVGEIAMIPDGFQSIRLVARENMRVR
jgi:hypothetical protein